MRLHINIDHVATVREARRTTEPDPVRAAVLAELGGADGITVHLREDRRHIQDRDLRLLLETVSTGVNLEFGAGTPVLEIALASKPMAATLVPERREELTTEGGLALDDGAVSAAISPAIDRLRSAGVPTSLFIDPVEASVRAAASLGASAVELHTGEYANADAGSVGKQPGPDSRAEEVQRLRRAAALGTSLGLHVHAGHGLTYRNVGPVAAIEEIEELNIGHSVVSRSVLVGMERAVREMSALIRRARHPAAANSAS